MTLAQLLGDTEDAVLIKSASIEKVTSVTSKSGHRDITQSGQSRAWGQSGNVD